MICNICNSEKTKPLFNLSLSHKIFSCSNCGVQFMYPQLNDKEINTLYSETYYKSWGIAGTTENESSRQMKIATFLLRLKLINKYVLAGKVLDVGCATGYFLEAAITLNYEPYGIELSEYSSSIAKNKFGNSAIFNGKLENCNFDDNMFDIISMFDLIEHVRSPYQTLIKTSALLNTNGIIIITTPNNSSISNKLMGKKWTHYKLEHFYYFNLKSLTSLAEQCALKIIYSENSKKALNLNYLHTQLNVYKHWLFTPVINFLCFILPNKIINRNFHISIGEITVVLKK